MRRQDRHRHVWAGGPEQGCRILEAGQPVAGGGGVVPGASDAVRAWDLCSLGEVPP